MQTSIVAYPHIGKQRELKYLLEKYWRKEISAATLEKGAAALRQVHWQNQVDGSLDYLTINDFSLYDTVLDTACLFNIIPTRYRRLGLSAIDTYFALARGYRGEKGTVAPLAMKKWFNTNYHYIVPEFSDDCAIKLISDAPLAQYREAASYQLQKKLLLLGPFTLLKLSAYSGSKGPAAYVPTLIRAYLEFFRCCQQEKVDLLQLDEPALTLDLHPEDLILLNSLYSELLAGKGKLKILLQTYFGDVRDCYDDLIKLDFDALGLDFVEGEKTLQLVSSAPFPTDKILFAGIVNGRNVWRNSYTASLNLIKNLQLQGINLVLQSSCSLQHVPYSLTGEKNLPPALKEKLAFGEEKIRELLLLKELAAADPAVNSNCCNADCIAVSNADCNTDNSTKNRAKLLPLQAKVTYEQRAQLQQQCLNLPLLPTTTIGSFPQSQAVRQNRRLYNKQLIKRRDYEKFNYAAIKKCIRFQEEMGLDVLVHGEFERNDMVEFFAQQLSGFVVTQNGWIQSYGSRCVKPPIIVGDIKYRQAMTVKWSKYAQSLTAKPVKAVLTGPTTIVNWSFNREDIPAQNSILQLAAALKNEVAALEKSGSKIIQIDEPALREKLPLRKADQAAYLEIAVNAFQFLHNSCRPETMIQTHICYSDYTDIIPWLDKLDADVILLEASRTSPSCLPNPAFLQLNAALSLGVYDVHSECIPSVAEFLTAIKQRLAVIPAAALWVAPDCGLKTRTYKELAPSLKNMVTACRKMRQMLSLPER